MTHPNVMAARGMTRHALAWLDGDVAGDWPFVTRAEAPPDAPTPLFWSVVADHGGYAVASDTLAVVTALARTRRTP
jgi:hypothetical protein